jgi:hypothetical protein
MKLSQIMVGKIYRNRGAGTTHRKVTGIGVEFQPERRFSAERPDDMPGVEYVQRKAVRARFWGDWEAEPRRMWLDSFASWAGEVWE